MKTTGKILIVDDDNDILVAGKLLLKRKFTDVSTCNQPEHIPTFFEKQHFDVVLLDMNFGPGESSGAQGFYWLKRIKKIAPQSIIIMITAHGGVDVAVEVMLEPTVEEAVDDSVDDTDVEIVVLCVDESDTIVCCKG